MSVVRTGPRIIGRATVARSRLFRVDEVDLEFENGQRRRFEQLVGSGAGSVLVVPVLGDDILLIEEYALGVDRYELGFVKGIVEYGESPEEAAQRELAEEIGYRAGQLDCLGRFTLMPAYSDFTSHIFLARELSHDPRTGDEPEPLTVHRWPLGALKKLTVAEGLTDARTHLAIHLVATLPPLNPKQLDKPTQ